MSNMRSYRMSVLRYVAGNGRRLRMLRRLRKDARRKKTLRKFGAWVKKSLPKFDDERYHVHPRHERDPKFTRAKRNRSGRSRNPQ